MKKLLVAAVFLSSGLAFAEEDLTLSQAYTFNCNGPKIFCMCPTRGQFRKVVREQKVCGDSKTIKFKKSELQKSFSDGGDQMNCEYSVSYVCE